MRLALAFALATLTVVSAACERKIVLKTLPVAPESVQSVVTVPEGRAPAPGFSQVLGTGWYAQVEVDGQGRVHYAWVDADLGDVMYALAPAGSVQPGTPVVVEREGAVGSYLKLAIGPGDVPVLSYYHQDQQMLRLAVRSDDLAVMQAAGAQIDLVTKPEPQPWMPKVDPDKEAARMGPGWQGEDVVFGDNAGLAGALVVDSRGYPHLSYYSKGQRYRYVRRPRGAPAFGPSVAGRFEKLDVSDEAGGSHSMKTDLFVAESGAVVATFCNWNWVDAQLKVGVLAPGAKAFQELAFPIGKEVDGWHSTILETAPGVVDIFSVATGEKELTQFSLKLDAPALPRERPTLLERPGPAVVRKNADGDVWILTRGVGADSLGETSGIWLVELPGGDVAKAKRWLVEAGSASDPWIDLAILPDGRPLAVWTTANRKSMHLYVP